MPTTKAKNPITIFLGGDCSDNNEWRQQVIDRYSGRPAPSQGAGSKEAVSTSEIDNKKSGTFYFIDPYDPDWDASENIYTEIADMINSDLIIFYKGGEGADKEKQLLKDKDIGIDFQEFDDIDALTAFLDEVEEDPDSVLGPVAEDPYPSTTDTEANAQTGGSIPYAVNYTLQSKHSSAIAQAIATVNHPHLKVGA
jgi:hypothetical protein